MEQWKDVEGFEGYYMVSNYGRVKSLVRQVVRSDGKTKTFQSKMLSISEYSNGYKRVTLSKDGEYKDYLINRLVAKHFIENSDPSTKIEVNHKDGDRGNNHYLNLEWCTSSENSLHAFRTGLAKQHLGESNIHSKLTDEQVIEIKNLYKSGGYTHRKLASMFSVGRTLIYEILNNKTRQYLEV